MELTAKHQRRPGGLSDLRADTRRVVLTDEPARYRLRLGNLEARRIPSVDLEQLTRTGWQTVRTVRRRGANGDVVDGTVRLGAGATQIRCRAGDRVQQSVTPSLLVDVRAAPRPLMLLGGKA